MAKYTIVLTKKAKKQLDKLNDDIAAPILESINSLGGNPRPSGYIKLKGREGYRIRTGNYRVIYTILDLKLIVEIVALGHRKDIYE